MIKNKERKKSRKIIALILSILSLIIPWFILLVSLDDLTAPIIIACTGSLVALFSLIISVPQYLKNMRDYTYLAIFALGIIGLFYSLPIVLILFRLSLL